SEYNTVGPGEVDMLEDAFRKPRSVKRLDGMQLIAADQYDFTGLYFANVSRSNQIKGACFRSEDVGIMYFAEIQRSKAVRVPHGDERVLRQQQQRERALDFHKRFS